MAMRKLIETIRADLVSRGERGKLMRSAGATAALNVGNILVAFLASLLYARVLGPHDYGLYAYVIACTQILIIPASLGLSAYLVREGAKSPQSLLWLRNWADRLTWVTGLIAAAILACGYFVPAAAGARVLFAIAAPLPLLTNLSSVRKALVQAHGWVARSQWPLLVLSPLFTLIVVGALWVWRGGFTPAELMLATVVGVLLPIVVNAKQLKFATRGAGATEPIPVWIKAALPFMWLNAMYLINSRVDVIMLGSMRGAREAGIYAITVRAAELVPFLLTVANLTIAPKISRLHHEGNMKQLQRLTTATAVRVLLATLPLALGLAAGAYFLLKIFYGSDFTEGTNVIRILAISQLLVVAMGPVGVLLNMTAHADQSAKAFGLGAALNITLNAVLIPFYGMVGSALATGTSTVACNALRWYMVRRHLRLRPSCIGV